MSVHDSIYFRCDALPDMPDAGHFKQLPTSKISHKIGHGTLTEALTPMRKNMDCLHTHEQMEQQKIAYLYYNLNIKNIIV